MFYFAKSFGLKSDQHLISPYNINKHKRKTSIQAVWVEGIARIICEVTFFSHVLVIDIMKMRLWDHLQPIKLHLKCWIMNVSYFCLKMWKEKSVDVITFGDLSYIMNFIECDGFFPEQR